MLCTASQQTICCRCKDSSTPATTMRHSETRLTMLWRSCSIHMHFHRPSIHFSTMKTVWQLCTACLGSTRTVASQAYADKEATVLHQTLRLHDMMDRRTRWQSLQQAKPAHHRNCDGHFGNVCIALLDQALEALPSWLSCHDLHGQQGGQLSHGAFNDTVRGRLTRSVCISDGDTWYCLTGGRSASFVFDSQAYGSHACMYLDVWNLCSWPHLVTDHSLSRPPDCYRIMIPVV